MSDFQSMNANISHRRYLHNRPCDTLVYHNCDMKTFADRVRAARKAAGLTQKQLAAKSGLSQTTISDIERGRNETSADVVALARALKVLAEWLADGKGPRNLEEARNPLGTYPKALEANEPPPENNLVQLNVEARARVLAEQAGEVAALWMTLPADRREELLLQLRTEAGRPAGAALVIQPRKRKAGAATSPDIKGRQGAD